MRTLKDRVAQLIGEQEDAQALSQWMTDGARLVIQSLPQGLLWLVSTELQDQGQGVVVGTGKVLYAHRMGRRAQLVPASMRAAFSDAGSIHAATDLSPVFWLDRGKAHVRGSSPGGSVVVVRYPNVDARLPAVDGFPDDLEQLLVFYAAYAARSAQIAKILPPTQGAAVAPPAAPQLAVAGIVIPRYIHPPVLTMPELPAKTGLVLPPSPSSFFAPSVSLPTTPAFPALDLSGLTPPTIPTRPPMSSPDAEATPPQATLLTDFIQAPTYTKPTMPADFSDDLDRWAASYGAEDVEMMASVLGKIEHLLSQYGLDLQNELQRFNRDVEVYRGGLQRMIEQARITAAERAQKAQQETTVAAQNKDRMVQSQLRSYELDLQRADGELSKYQAQVNTRVQEYQAGVVQVAMVKWQTETANLLRKYEADIASARAAAEVSIGSYQARVQAAISEHEAKTGEDLSHYRAEAEAVLGVFERELRASMQAFESQVAAERLRIEDLAQQNQALVSRYQFDVQRYQAETVEAIQRYSQAMERFAVERQALASDAERLWALFQNGLNTFLQREVSQ